MQKKETLEKDVYRFEKKDGSMVVVERYKDIPEEGKVVAGQATHNEKEKMVKAIKGITRITG